MSQIYTNKVKLASVINSYKIIDIDKIIMINNININVDFCRL